VAVTERSTSVAVSSVVGAGTLCGDAERVEAALTNTATRSRTIGPPRVSSSWRSVKSLARLPAESVPVRPELWYWPRIEASTRFVPERVTALISPPAKPP
jgi:hypothetical protein